MAVFLRVRHWPFHVHVVYNVQHIIFDNIPNLFKYSWHIPPGSGDLCPFPFFTASRNYSMLVEWSGSVFASAGIFGIPQDTIFWKLRTSIWRRLHFVYRKFVNSRIITSWSIWSCPWGSSTWVTRRFFFTLAWSYIAVGGNVFVLNSVVLNCVH